MPAAKYNHLKINKAAQFLGVSTKTLRRWETRGILLSKRTSGNQRIYELSDLVEFRRHQKQTKSLARKVTQDFSSANYQKRLEKVNEKLQKNIQGFELQKNQKIVLGSFLSALVIIASLVLLDKKGLVKVSSLEKNQGEISSALLSAREKYGPILASVGFSQLGNLNKTVDQNISFSKLNNQSVLGAVDVQDATFGINLPAKFAETVDVVGNLTAPNITYTVSGGTGIQVTGGQNPVVSLKAGAIPVVDSFSSIKVGSDTITAATSSDTLNFAAGTGLSVSSNTTTKTITYSANASDLNISGWTDDGTTVRLTTSSDLVGIGTTTGTAKLNLDSTSTDLLSASKGGTSVLNLTNTGILTLANGGLLDLSQITQSSTTAEGFKLPQGASLTNISGGGKGYLAYDTSSNLVKVFDGSNWSNISGASTTLQNAYDNSSPDTINLSTANGSVSIINPASGGTGGSNVLSIRQLAAGAIDTLNITNSGTGAGINLNNSTITNIGNAGTFFNTSGGLTLASNLAVNGGSITSTGSLSLVPTTNLLFSDARVTNLPLSVTDTALNAALPQAIVDAINQAYLVATGGTGSSGFFQLNSKVLSPYNSTLDLAVGGNSTASAKFQAFAGNGNLKATSTSTSGDSFAFTNNSLNTASANLANFTFQNNNTAAAGLAVNGVNVVATGAAPLSGSNTENLVNLSATALSNNTFNGINFGSGLTNYINGTNFIVTAAGAETLNSSLTSVGVNSQSGLIQGTGGITVTGTANINNSGSATTNLGTGTGNVVLGNTSGTLSISSLGGLNVTTGGNITAGTYNGDTLNSTALTFSGANPVISASTLNTGLTVNSNGSGTLTLDSTGNGIVNLGNGSSAKTINIGTGVTGNSINLGTAGTTTISLLGISSSTGSALCLDGSNHIVTCTVGSGGISGSGTSGQVAFFNGPSSITSETSGFAWDTTNKLFSISSPNDTGSIISATASGITTGNILKLGQGGNTNFSGNAILADIDNTGQGNLGFTGNFALFKNAGTSKFQVDSSGDTLIAAGSRLDTITSGTLGIGTTTTNQINIGRSGANVAFTLGGDATGDVFYRNSSGNFTHLGIGTNGQVLTVSPTGIPSWTGGTGGGTGAAGWFQRNSGVVSPLNITDDLTIGGVATTSASTTFQAYGTEATTSDIVDLTSHVITTGNVLSATASAITSGNLLKLGEGGNQGFTGNAILADIDNTGGGGLSFTGNFALFKNAGTSEFQVDSLGNTLVAAGDRIDTITAGTLKLGTTTANAITIGSSGVTTTNTGSLTSTQTLTASNGFTLSTGALNMTSTSGTSNLTSTATSGDSFAYTNNSLNTASANLSHFTFQNNNTAGAGLAVNGINVTATGSTPLSGTNTENLVNLSATALGSNTFNGINFGTGLTNYINGGNWVVTAAGAETLGSNLAVNGGSITTTNTTGNLFAANATTINIGPSGSSAGTIALAGGSSDTGCTVNDATGDFTCTGNITGSSSGTLGYWSRSGTTLSPATSGDNVTTSGNISTSGSGTITSAGLLTGQLGLTVTGAVASLNASSNFNTNINTGNSTGAVSIGNSLAGAIALSTSSTFGVTTTTSPQTFTSANVSGTGTSGSFVFTDNSLTSGTGAYLNSSSITSGTLLSLSSTSTALTSGQLANFDWSPGSTTTATGNLFNINVGANALVSGNIFNVQNNASNLFSINQAQITATLPTQFTSSGDVAIAYDLVFTNPTASTIRSTAPIYITSGEVFNSSDLNLSTYNKGNVLVNSEAFVTSAAATVSGQLVAGTNAPSSASIGGFYLTNASTYGKALAIFNQTESQDIFTASASGTAKFTISNTGTLTLANSDTIANGSSGTITFTPGSGTTETLAVATATTLNLFNTQATTISLGGAASTINIGPTGSAAGSVIIAGGSGDTGCTLNDATGDFTCSGNITGSSSGTAGFWTRTSTTLSPATANDIVSITSNSATAPLTLSPTGATRVGLSIGTLAGATANTGVSIGAITAAANSSNFGINIGAITPQASTTAYSINTSGFAAGAGTATYGINLGTNASTATTNYGLFVGAISGASTTNYGEYIDNLSGGTTSKGLLIGTNSSATATGIDIGALSGGTANLGVTIGAISGGGTASSLNTGTISSTGATAQQINLGTITGANATSHSALTAGNISGTTATATGITLGTLTGGTTANYQLNTGAITSVTTTTNAQLNLGGIVTTGGTSNYGVNIGALSGSGTTNYGVNIATLTSTGTTSGGINITGLTGAATTNYGINIGNISGGTTTDGIAIGALSGATSNGLVIGALSGTSADTGISVGAISAGTGTNNGISLSTLTGGSGSSGNQISTGAITSIASGTWTGINLGGISGAGTETDGIKVGANTATATSNYGLNIGGITGAGTTNAALNIGSVSGSTSNYGVLFANAPAQGSIAAATNVNLGLTTTGTGSQIFTSGVTTGTTTSGAFVFTANSVTSGTGGYISSSSITSGKLLDVNTGAGTNTLTSGILLNVASQSTGLTSGNLALFDWSPSPSATATGDLVKIHIGPQGDLNGGNLFNIVSDTSSLFSVNENQVTASIPVALNAPGDVSVAYDINFTNQVASYIKSNAPLYLQAGESFESNNLTLQTYNSGRVVTDANGNGGGVLFSSNPAIISPVALFQVDGAETGKALAILNESGNQNILAASASGTTEFTLDRSGNISVASAANFDTLAASGTLNIANTNTTTLNIANSTTTTAINIGGTLTSGAIAIGGGSAVRTGDITIGSTGQTSGRTIIRGGTGTGTFGNSTSGIDIIPGVAGTINVGASAGAGTGAITIGQSTANYTLNLGLGVTAAGNTKNIHIGDTQNASTGVTAIAIGLNNTSTGVNTVTIKAGGSGGSAGPSVTLGASASTFAVCSSIGGSGAPVAGTAYELRDCSGAPVSDYAEQYPTASGVDFGDVVAAGPDTVPVKISDPVTFNVTDQTTQTSVLIKSTQAYQSNIIGVTSNNYGDFSSIGQNVVDPSDHPLPVALNGRVPVKVASDSANISPGDYLTSSGTEPGKAMKATGAGYVIGKALSYWTQGSGEPTVLVFVNSFYYPALDIASIDNTNSQQQTATDSAQPTTDYGPQIADLTSRVSALEAASPNSTASASLQSSIDLINTKMDYLQSQIDLLKNATGSAEVLGTATSSGTFTDLGVTGNTVLSDTVVNGKLTVGTMTLDNVNSSIDATGTLKVQDLALGNIEFLGDKIEMDTNGDLKVTNGVIVGNDKFRGSETISSGQTFIQVNKTGIWTSAPSTIQVTPSYKSQVWVTNITQDGFTINVSSTPTTDANLYWTAIW